MYAFVFDPKDGALANCKVVSVVDLLSGKPKDLYGKIIYLANRLYHAGQKVKGASDVHLIRKGLARRKWEHYSFPVEGDDLDFVSKLIIQFAPGACISRDMHTLFSYMLDKKHLAYGVNKGHAILATLVMNSKVEFDKASSALGIDFLTGDKTEKRVGQVGRNYLRFASLKDVTYRVIEDPALEKALDGSLTVSREFYDKVVKTPGPRDCNTLNFRAWIPGVGAIKGMALVADTLDVDMVFHRTNVKNKESNYRGDKTLVAWDPQPGKTKAYLGKQTLTNASWFWGIDVVDVTKTRPFKWAYAALKELANHLQEGLLPVESREELEELMSNEDLKDSFTSRSRLNCIDYAAAGGRVAEIPALFKSSVENAFERILSTEDKSMDFRVQIPGAIYTQIISLEMAKYIAPRLYESGLEYGKVIYLSSHKLCVVNTQYWLDNLVNWGGCDGDDKFTLVYRRNPNGRGVLVFIYRTPNSRNEYALAEAYGALPPLEGDWENEPLLLPKDRPLQLSQMAPPVELPKATLPDSGKPRDGESFLKSLGYGNNPGFFIHLETMWDSAYRTKCPQPSQESVVDLCVAVRNPHQMMWLKDNAYNILSIMEKDAQEGRAKFDATVAKKVLGVAKKAYEWDFSFPKSAFYHSPYSRFVFALRERVLAGLVWFDGKRDQFTQDCWAAALPKLRSRVDKVRRDFGDTFMNMIQDRVNKVFVGFSSSYMDPMVSRFRAEFKKDGTRLHPMGFEFVQKAHHEVLVTQLSYLWKKFKVVFAEKGYRCSRKTFVTIVTMVAFYQLFGQADDDKSNQLHGKHDEGFRDKGSLVMHSRLFRHFLRVRKMF